MKIHSARKDYEVRILDSFEPVSQLSAMANTGFVIDRKVYKLYPQCFQNIPEDRLFLVDATEENKVIETALSLCEKMAEIPGKKNARIVSVGGGITQDISGFAASILYRGVLWIYVPTTLLAACDSCIGGKTSLNYRRYKNLLGTFFPPDEILICPAFFRTLSDRDYESGLGEVVKFNIIAGTRGLSSMEENLDQLLARNEEQLRLSVEGSLRFKKDFIEADEFDRGERVKLNFAHTFGHGIETITDYAVPHGTAVAIGMIMANRLSVCRGMLAAETASRCESLLLPIIHINADLRTIQIEQFTNAMKKDKKQIGGQFTAILMTDRDGDLQLVHDVQEAEIKDAVLYFCEKYYCK